MAGKKGKRKRARRKPAGEGLFYDFHGSFSGPGAEDRARARARKDHGWVISRWLPGWIRKRFIVMTKPGERAPF